jgi:hypothetical protein
MRSARTLEVPQMRSKPVQRISVPLQDDQVRRALVNLAQREMRDPRDQAAVLIREGLRAAGALPELNTAAGRQPAEAVPA